MVVDAWATTSTEPSPTHAASPSTASGRVSARRALARLSTLSRRRSPVHGHAPQLPSLDPGSCRDLDLGPGGSMWSQHRCLEPALVGSDHQSLSCSTRPMSSRHAQCSTITPSATRQMWMNVHAAARPEGLTRASKRHGGCAVRAVQREVQRHQVSVADQGGVAERRAARDRRRWCAGCARDPHVLAVPLHDSRRSSATRSSSTVGSPACCRRYISSTTSFAVCSFMSQNHHR